jgi:hypothetical protein
MRFPQGGVNGHHPYCLFTRVITAGLFAPAAIWDGTGPGGVSLGGLKQAELAGPGDRCGAAFNSQFAVQGTLVGFHGVQ